MSGVGSRSCQGGRGRVDRALIVAAAVENGARVSRRSDGGSAGCFGGFAWVVFLPCDVGPFALVTTLPVLGFDVV